MKTFDGFGGLREEVDRPVKIKPVELVRGLDDNRGVVGLTLQTNHFRVPGFAVDDDLRRLGFVIAVRLVAGTDSVLQFLNDRAGGIDDLNAALLCDPIGGRRFAVCTKQDTRVGG